MNRKLIKYVSCVFGVTLTIGCGQVPDVITDAARVSAKNAIEETVDEWVAVFVDEAVGELLEFEDFDLPFEGDLDFEAGELIDEFETPIDLTDGAESPGDGDGRR